MIKVIKKYFRDRKHKRFLIQCELERLKEDFVYKYLLNNYEAQLKGKVDLPAWHYATEDIKQIKETGKLNEAHDYAQKILSKQSKNDGGIA